MAVMAVLVAVVVATVKTTLDPHMVGVAVMAQCLSGLGNERLGR
jgi:hypothetical protein